MNKIISQEESSRMLGHNSDNARKIALDFLDQNPPLYIDVSQPIRRGFANILFADSDKGVIVQETKGGTFFLALKDLTIGRRFIDKLDQCQLLNTRSQELAKAAQKKFHLETIEPVYQYIITNCKRPDMKQTDMEIHLARPKDLDLIMENYHIYDKEDFLEMIDRGELFGGYVNGCLAGFVGMHEEGSLGILHVMEEYRRQGYGKILEAYDVYTVLDKGWVPYGQVDIDNEASLALQEKMGNIRSDGIVYWVFNE